NPATIGGKGVKQKLAPVLVDGRGSDHYKVAGSGQRLTYICGGGAQHALLDENFVVLGPGLNLYANQVSILTVRAHAEYAAATEIDDFLPPCWPVLTSVVHMNSVYDFIVVGAGVAGLRAAIELTQHGSVLCLAKLELTESNTQYAQGGIAVALAPDDSPEIHLRDTLSAGAGLVNESAARTLVEDGPKRVLE